MNKFDKIFALILLLLTIIIFILTSKTLNVSRLEAVVYKYDQEIARYDMNVDQQHTVKGDLGDIVIEIKNGRVRIKEEISPLHYCSIMSWQDRINSLIVCLPNGVYIHIEGSEAPSNRLEDVKIR